MLLAMMLGGCFWRSGKERPAPTAQPAATKKPPAAAAKPSPQAPADQPPVAEAPTRDSRVFAASFDGVWKAAVETLAEMKLPIESMEQESGLVATAFMSFQGAAAPPALARVSTKASAADASWSQARYSLNVVVTPGGVKRTNISVTAHIEGFASGAAGGWRLCFSNGFLEKQFFDSVATKLAGAR